MHWKYEFPERDQYEKNLRKIQKEHLKRVWSRKAGWKPCRHDGCSECHGTGIKLDGSSCVHMLCCDCPKCSPMYLSTT